MTDADPNDDFDGRIAVVGMACRTPGASNVAEFWENIRAGRESLTTLSDDELREAGVPESLLDDPNYVKRGMFLDKPAAFDAAFFGFTPRDAKILDPQHRHFLEVCWEALEDGGYDPHTYEGSIGVFGGSGHNAYMPYNLLTNPDLANEVGFFLLRHTGNDKDFLTTRVSYNFDLRGPSLNIQTACSTSLVGVHVAAQSLLNVECDMALAGGVSIMLPLGQGYLHEEGGIVSVDGHCRAFDAESTGTIISSGVGVVLLKRLDDAIRDKDVIHGVILGSAVNNDGVNKVNYLAPSVDGQAAAIVEALEVSDVEADSIEFIECHGTGTKIGDPIEVAALTQAYGRETERRNYCALGSVKSNIGHTDTAAGVLGMIKALCSLEAGEIAPTVHYKTPNPEIDFDNSPFFVNAELRTWDSDGPRRAAVSSLGVGGTNAHVILEEAPHTPQRHAKSRNLLCLSAKTENALEQKRRQLMEFLKSHPGTNPSDLEFTLMSGRHAMPVRCSLPVIDTANAIERLADTSSDLWNRASAPDQRPELVFMYAGGGAQHPNMGRDLYESQPVFRKAMQQCADILKRYVDYDLLALIYPAEEQIEQAASEMEKPSRSLPSLFSVQYAQSMLWKSMGVEPNALIGHSMGENTALCVAGSISLEEGLSMVAKRGQLQEQAPEGGMLSVMASPSALQPYLTDDLTIGVYNAPEMSVVSGPVDQLQVLQQNLEEDDIQAVRVRINVAAHSRMLDPVLDEFESHLSSFDYQPPTIPIASTFSGEWLTDSQAADAEYWTDQLRNPVRFSDAAELLLKDSNKIFLEIGPSTTLTSLLAVQASGGGRVVRASSRRATDDRDDNDVMLSALGALWCADFPVDWNLYQEGNDVGRVQLPTYPFEHQDYWVEPGRAGVESTAAVGRSKDTRDWYFQSAWSPTKSATSSDSLDSNASLIVISSGDNRADQLVSRLRDSGIVPEIISSNDNAAIERYLESPSNQQSQKLIILWVVNCDDELPLGVSANSVFRQGFNLAKSLAGADLEDVQLSVLTTGSIQCLPGESVQSVAASSLHGLVRVLPNEISGLSVRLVDIDWLDGRGMEGTTSALDRVISESLRAVDSVEVSCIRRGQCFEEMFTPIAQDSLGDGLSTDLAEKHILISGGLGGLGLNAAEMLASRGCRRISLIGRSEFPDPAEWASLKQHDSRVARQITAVEALKSAGVSVHLITADVADAEQANAAVSNAREQNGSLNGLIHAAGTLDDELLAIKNIDSALSVFSPKVLGAVNLVEAASADAPEFVAFYSSVSSYLGVPGQTDYAAANAFLDTYTRHLNSSGIPATSINWSVWQDIGMAADLDAGRTSKGAGFPSFEPRQRDDCYEICIDENDWRLNEHRTRDGVALMPGTGLVELVSDAAGAMGSIDDGRTLIIENMALYLPLSVERGVRQVVTVNVQPGTESTEFEILSAASPNASARGEWAGEHVQGRFAVVDTASPDITDIEKVKASLEEDGGFDLNGQTSTFMVFGGRWDCLRRVWSGQKEMLGELVLDDRYSADLDKHRLHPALFDIAIAGLQSIQQMRVNPDEFLIPMSYREIRVLKSLPATVYSRVFFVESATDDQREFDIDVLDSAGELLVRVKGFAMKVGNVEMLQASSTSSSLASSMDMSNGISPSEGSECLAKIIDNPNHAQVIISPVQFDTVVAESRLAAIQESAENSQQTERSLSTDFVAPETPFQLALAAIWEKGLGMTGIGVNDNFFSLGGHSLLLTQLAARMKKELKVNPKVSLLFDNPTIAEWERHANDGEAASTDKPTAIKRVSRDRYRVSST